MTGEKVSTAYSEWLEMFGSGPVHYPNCIRMTLPMVAKTQINAGNESREAVHGMHLAETVKTFRSIRASHWTPLMPGCTWASAAPYQTSLYENLSSKVFCPYKLAYSHAGMFHS